MQWFLRKELNTRKLDYIDLIYIYIKWLTIMFTHANTIMGNWWIAIATWVILRPNVFASVITAILIAVLNATHYTQHWIWAPTTHSLQLHCISHALFAFAPPRCRCRCRCRCPTQPWREEEGHDEQRGWEKGPHFIFFNTIVFVYVYILACVALLYIYI